jgi:arylformamidase
MPYFLAPPIEKTNPALWAEGSPYKSEIIYDLCSDDLQAPPVHYESHTLKPHSVCHFDAPAHIVRGDLKIEDLYREHSSFFYGPAVVAVFDQPKFIPHRTAPGVSHWEISLSDLKATLSQIDLKSPLTKLILSYSGISADFYQQTDKAITLSVEAATYLTDLPGFNLIITPWKSVDFQPQSRERPVHKIFFKSAGILECVNVEGIPSGEYFLAAAPIPLHGATESPVAPVLFTRGELQF